ncbi:hypothetical protein [Rhizobium leguminosarum]|uniref:hypothetical protein n=1 Tax=Rhizobium leguminosarum TaxID=384 RepID=UPI003F97433D
MIIVLKIILIAFFVLTWLRSRKSSSLEVSDFFILSFISIYVPGFLFNPSGETKLNGLNFTDAVQRQAQFGFIIALLFGAGGFYLRYIVEKQIPVLRNTASKLQSSKISRALSIWAAIASIGFLLLLLLSPEFREFKTVVLKFFSFQLKGPEYRNLRNAGFSDSWVIEDLVGRARFTVFPVLFCLIIYPLLNVRYIGLAVLVGAVYFVMLPASLSKLPVFFFLGYVTILLLERMPSIFDIAWMSILAIAGAGLITACLVVLYASQYRESVGDGTVQPLHLAIERLWGEPFSIVVRYFAVYPKILPFTGWSGVNLVAKFIGLVPRLPDIEVAQALLGPDSGSNPGVFFLGGYAAFGLPGLCIFSILGILLLWALDIIGRRIRVLPLKATYVAVVGMNVMFLNQISLQTALVTYGLAIIPAGILILDRLLASVFFSRYGKVGDVGPDS